MALIPPTLLVGLLVVFVYTRLSGFVRPLERLLFYGLPYVVEPSLEAIRSGVQSGGRGGGGTSGGNTKTKKHAKEAQRGSASIPLEIQRIGEEFFTIVRRPFSHEFEQSAAFFIAFLIVYILELILKFGTAWDGALMGHHLGMGTVAVCVVSLSTIVLHIGTASLEAKAAGVVFILSGFCALLLTAPGQGSRFVHVDVDAGVAALRTTLDDFLVKTEVQLGNSFFGDFERAARITLAVIMALVTAAVALPSIRFAQWFHAHNLRGADTEMASSSVSPSETAETGAARPTRKQVVFYLLILDVILPLLVTLLYIDPIARDIAAAIGKPQAAGLRLGTIIVACLLRFGLFRVRMQDYLSTALAYVQTMLSSGAPIDPQAVQQKVFAIHYYSVTVALQYLLPAVIPLVASLMSAMHHMSFGNAAVRTLSEAVAFWSIASWTLIHIGTLATERVTEQIVPELKFKRN